MYINSYVIPVHKNKKSDYLSFAETYAEVAMDYGAVQVYENWELEVPDGEHTDYRRAVIAGEDERIVVAWTIWPDRETGARAHKEMFEDPRLGAMQTDFIDSKRIIMGGFEPIVVRSSG